MIVLINGNQPRCGKDTLAKQFELRGYTHLKFADALHKEVCSVFDIDRPDDSDKDIVKYQQYGDVTYRQLLIVYGTARKHKDLLFWASALCDEMLNISEKNYVISDWGFFYELPIIGRRLYEHHITTIHVRRPITAPVPDSRENLEYVCTYVLDNSGTRNEYISQCKELVQEVIEKYGG
jgi:hypothetical protein